MRADCSYFPFSWIVKNFFYFGLDCLVVFRRSGCYENLKHFYCILSILRSVLGKHFLNGVCIPYVTPFLECSYFLFKCFFLYSFPPSFLFSSLPSFFLSFNKYVLSLTCVPDIYVCLCLNGGCLGRISVFIDN